VPFKTFLRRHGPVEQAIGVDQHPAGHSRAQIGEAKLAACGIHVARGVAIHGWALDVATPAEMWRRIRPCGLGVPQVSLAERLGRDVAVATVAELAAPRLQTALL